MSRPEYWTRHSYPVQPSQTTWPPTTSILPETASQCDQIPFSIRACKDASAFKPQGRTLIVCLDGTGDKFDNDNSNIVHLVSCLKKDDPSQVTYYQSGIGTYNSSGLATGLAAAFDMAIGSGLGVHVRDAYQFLMQTYREGDKICLFGFSRGAYTARCLAGMLHKVGLLPAHNRAQVPFAYQFYKDDTALGWEMSREFKRTFAIDCSVYFVGVWDCVASVGFIPRKLPFSSTPTSRTGHFRHAMALDEHRAKFKVCHWVKQDKSRNDSSQPPTRAHVALLNARDMPKSAFKGDRNSKPTSASSTSSDLQIKEKIKKHIEVDPEQETRGPNPGETDVLEVWFTGCHADVGGGAVPNNTRHMLSRIPLRWMIRQCFECDTGILFDTSALAEKGLDVHTLWPVYNPVRRPVVGPSPATMELYEKGELEPLQRRATSLSLKTLSTPNGSKISSTPLQISNNSFFAPWVTEQHEDYFDSLAPLNDQLVQARGWWMLEFWPIKIRIQKSDSEDWEKKVGFNLGRGRAVQDAEPNLHWTVKERIREMAGKESYKSKTRMARNAIWKVVT